MPAKCRSPGACLGLRTRLRGSAYSERIGRISKEGVRWRKRCNQNPGAGETKEQDGHPLDSNDRLIGTKRRAADVDEAAQLRARDPQGVERKRTRAEAQSSSRVAGLVLLDNWPAPFSGHLSLHLFSLGHLFSPGTLSLFSLVNTALVLRVGVEDDLQRGHVSPTQVGLTER